MKNLVRIYSYSLLTFSLATASFAATQKESHETRSEKVESQGITEYGSIYMMEQLERKVYPWRTSLGYSFEFGNPYSNVHGFNFTFEHSIGRFVWVGVQLNTYVSSKTQLMNTLENDLNAQGITSTVHNPRYSIYPIFTLVPLSGHFNFFGNQPIEAELAVRLGVGNISYSDTNRLGILWSIRPTLHFNPQWSLQTGFGQEIESPFNSSSSLSHYRGDLAVSYQFGAK